MYPDTNYATGRGSFLRPVPHPSGIESGQPTKTVVVPCGWLPYIRGALQQLLLQSTWQEDTPATLAALQGNVFNLIDLFSECDGSTLPFDCDYDYLTSDGAWGLNPRGGQIPSTSGEYVAAGGWFNTLATASPGVATTEAVDIHKLFSPAVSFTHVKMTYDLNRGLFDYGPWSTGIVGYLAGAAQFTALVSADSDSNGTGKTIDYTSAGVVCDEIRVLVVVGALVGGGEPGGSTAITQVLLEGVGSPIC